MTSSSRTALSGTVSGTGPSVCVAVSSTTGIGTMVSPASRMSRLLSVVSANDGAAAQAVIRRHRLRVERPRQHGAVGVVEDRAQRAAVQAAGHRRAHQVQDRRRQVGQLHRGGDAPAGERAARLLDEERPPAARRRRAGHPPASIRGRRRRRWSPYRRCSRSLSRDTTLATTPSAPVRGASTNMKKRWPLCESQPRQRRLRGGVAGALDRRPRFPGTDRRRTRSPARRRSRCAAGTWTRRRRSRSRGCAAAPPASAPRGGARTRRRPSRHARTAAAPSAGWCSQEESAACARRRG